VNALLGGQNNVKRNKATEGFLQGHPATAINAAAKRQLWILILRQDSIRRDKA
jgi:hypothetical protein